MWNYDDIYWGIIAFITRDLRDTDFTLNFGDVALSTHSNQALVKSILLNIHTNHSTRWTSVFMGKTIEELTKEVKVLVNLKKAGLDLALSQNN